MADSKYDFARDLAKARDALYRGYVPNSYDLQQAAALLSTPRPEEVAAQAAQDSAPAPQVAMQPVATPNQQDATQAQAAQVASNAAQLGQAAREAQQAQNVPYAASMAGTGMAPSLVQSAPVQPWPVYSGTSHDAIAPDQPMTWGQRSAYSDLYGAKQAWAAAQDDAGRQAAHAKAEGIRKAMKRYGLDDISGDMSADDLYSLIQMDNRMGVSKAMEGMTSNEYFEQEYNALRNAGVSERAAVDEAARRAGQYQSKRVRDLTNAYYMYGVNQHTGEMNDNGAAILNLIYDEQPTAAAMGMQNYASPIQRWKFNRNMDAVLEAYKEALGKMDKEGAVKNMLLHTQGDYSLAGIKAQTASAERIAQTNAEAKKAAAASLASARAGGGGSRSGGGSRGSGSGQFTSNAMSIIKNYNEYADKHPGEPNPWENYLPSAQNTLDAASGIKHDNDDYNYDQSDWTDVLEGNAKRMANGDRHYSREQLEDYAHSKYGDMADDILAGTNWGDYGL